MTTETSSTSPKVTLRLKKNEDRRLKQGHMWIYSNEVDTQVSPLKNFESGQVVTVESSNGKPLGIAYINPNTLICGRLLSRNPKVEFNQAFLKKRIQAALALREMNFEAPYYRLVFGESDGLPGLVVDRFGDVFVAQITTAGMEKMKAEITQTIENLFHPTALVYRNDTASRSLEGLESYEEVAIGTLPESIVIEENGAKFQIPVESGQKTGWFYDHRMARKRMQSLVQGKRVLDVFSYLGGWAMEAAVAGATEVVCVDASSAALDGVEINAELNGVSDKLTTYEGNAFDVLKVLIGEAQKFDVVIVDPPAFVKRRKDLKSGSEGYRRINELAMRLVENDGVLISASCSHHMSRDDLLQQVQSAAKHIDRTIQMFDQGHQGSDHPVHPAIAETEYLKSFFFKVSKTW
ncbi:class I SAM-dependent rRNA methyltransferase [Hydrogenovibrio sp. JE_KL2]|uniref:class I SAM-dependent rRNA methyltransferase n=1 Tax=Hydrogenovibrio sp. JE_KL2 TaxID=2651188 RepID=UPI00128B6FE7|nr:class I SAM-dependent rRNA methyltransferase [Hydrogenovibrio sp. JE_KL2]MPQ77517.1 class I SAM-dependent rRNA methyltransferase [Hydrogenovibrio sp. JE_KL2]